MQNVKTVPILVSLSLCGAGAALLYVWYKSRGTNKDEVDSRKIGPVTKAKKKQHTKVECTISNDVVPLVIGRAGANVKSIEDQTNTKIQFRKKDDTHQMCEISGLYENVMKAATLVKEQASRSANITEEMIISISAYTKLIERCGKTLQDICRRSQTQVRIDAGMNVDKTMRRVLITGPKINVNMAKRLIDDKVNEDLEEKEAETKREPRYTPRGPSSATSMEFLGRETPPLITTSNERLNIPNGLEGQLKVYVSAIASPARFWIQIVGPQTTKLDQLVEQMTEYYSQSENRELHKIQDPYLGQIVTAMFKYDSKWYRAEVVGILPNEFDPRNVVLDLYFLDYGDSEFVQPHEVYEIRTDFLTLRFQAIECFLAHCQPMYPTPENQWNLDAISRFEELSHVAKWKQLTAKIVTTKDRFKDAESSQREGSPIPGIELYDVAEDREINIASQLILEGFARPDNSVELPKPLSRYASSESIPRSEGANGHIGSVAEKALMFELNASLNNSNGNLKTNNGKLTPPGHKSPSGKLSPNGNRSSSGIRTPSPTRYTISIQMKPKTEGEDPHSSPLTNDTVVKVNNNNSTTYVPYQTMLNKNGTNIMDSPAAGNNT